MTQKITLETTEPVGLIDITDQLNAAIETQKLKNGLVNLLSDHTTATVTINESCDQLTEDLKNFLKELANPELAYNHNRVAVDGRANAHSHLLNFLMHNTPTIPVVQGKLNLGTWQRVFFVELDGPREKRSVTLSLMGEFHDRH